MTIQTNTRLFEVKSALLTFIRKNALKRNDQLPSEAQLAAQLGVSRNTLREAYISLENDGVIVRRHGIGTFIASLPRIQDSLNAFFPFAHIILEKGYTPRFETLDLSSVEAKGIVAEGLQVSTSTAVLCLKRLVHADQNPAIYILDYFAPEIQSFDIDWEQFDGNLVQFLSKYLKTPLHQIKSQIRAAGVGRDIVNDLKLPEKTPVLNVHSIIYDLDNKPITFSKIYFNSTIVELTTVRIIPKT
jgi:GntR family transcriptional regulator